MALVVLLAHLFRAWLLDATQIQAQGMGLVEFLYAWTPLGWTADGRRAVHIFFVISGVVLAYPVLRSAKPFRLVAAMAVWRYPRLTVPILASCLITWGLLAGGGMANVAAAARHAHAGWWADLYAFPVDFLDMLSFSLQRTYVYTERSWNVVLWTMQIELAGSFMIFALLAFVPRRWLRLAIAAALALYWSNDAGMDGYYVGFFVGYGLAELLAAAERSPEAAARLEAARPLGGVCIVAALALCQAQQAALLDGRAGSGAMLQHNVIAALAVIGVLLLKPLREALSNPLSRFLGRISFGLYLTHIVVICSFSSWLYLALVGALPYGLVVPLVGVVSVAAAIGVAWLFSLVVEERLLSAIKRPITAAVRLAVDEAERAFRGLEAARQRLSEMRSQ